MDEFASDKGHSPGASVAAFSSDWVAGLKTPGSPARLQGTGSRREGFLGKREGQDVVAQFGVQFAVPSGGDDQILLPL